MSESEELGGGEVAAEEIAYTYAREVTAAEIEPVYQHVHHAQSLRFLEEARCRYLEAIGCPLNEFVANGLFIVIAQVAVVYKREIFGGPILVTVESPRIEGKSLLVEQRIVNAKGKECVQASIELRFLSSATKRSIVPPADFAARFVGG
jgi:YbgC/YbaW family acyl-CoA thioester hydrolase